MVYIPPVSAKLATIGRPVCEDDELALRRSLHPGLVLDREHPAILEILQQLVRKLVFLGPREVEHNVTLTLKSVGDIAELPTGNNERLAMDLQPISEKRLANLAHRLPDPRDMPIRLSILQIGFYFEIPKPTRKELKFTRAGIRVKGVDHILLPIMKLHSSHLLPQLRSSRLRSLVHPQIPSKRPIHS